MSPVSKTLLLFLLPSVLFAQTGSISNWSAISVKQNPYSAKGDGITDDTTQIHNAMAAAASLKCGLYFPAGSYIYNSSYNWPSGYFYITGAGQAATSIILGNSSFFIDTSSAIQNCYLSGFTFSGGLGCFRSTYSDVNVHEQKIFTKNYFYNYTNCAIQNNGSDEPYWEITHNTFKAANSTGTIGIAISAGGDKSLISGNSFLKDRIHIKIKQGGISSEIQSNDFVQFDNGDGTPRAMIWNVPYSSSANAGEGFKISANKFGNESQQSSDYQIIIADEGSGAYNGDKYPVLSSPSTNFVSSQLITENKFSYSYKTIPTIFSTTQEIYSSIIKNNVFVGYLPSSVLAFYSSPTPDYLNESNVLGPNFSENMGTVYPPNKYSSTNIGFSNDPSGASEGVENNFHSYTGGGQDYNDYINLYNTISSAPTTFASATNSGAVTDSTGGLEAWTFNAPQNGGTINALSNIVVGNPTWVEFDLRQSASSPITQVLFYLRYTSNGAFHFKRYIAPSSSWKRYRFPFYFVEANTTVNFQVVNPTVTTGNFDIGRIRIYHAREPISFGTSYFEGLKCGTYSVGATPTPGYSGSVTASAGVTLHYNSGIMTGIN